MELAREIEAMEPFGEGTLDRVFMRGMRLRDIRFMGEEKNHVRFTAFSERGQATCVLFKRAVEKREIILGERRLISQAL